MNERLTPEQAGVKAITELMAMPGPKPLKPIPPELKAEALADLESEEEVARQVEQLKRTGGVPIEPVLEKRARMAEEGRCVPAIATSRSSTSVG